jgi:late competence protein required for DNA uptake (superfamily II DNA/RNA helicase)
MMKDVKISPFSEKLKSKNPFLLFIFKIKITQNFSVLSKVSNEKKKNPSHGFFRENMIERFNEGKTRKNDTVRNGN